MNLVTILYKLEDRARGMSHAGGDGGERNRVLATDG